MSQIIREVCGTSPLPRRRRPVTAWGLVSTRLHEIVKELWMARHAPGILGKSRLIIWMVLDCVPITIVKRSPILQRIMGMISLLLLKESIVLGDVVYSPVDRESLFILCPDFERWVWEWLKPQRGQVLVDVGAHAGKYALRSARIVGNDGLVIALEPNPKNFRALLKGIELNAFRNIIALNVAAWSRDCLLTLFLGEVAGHHSSKVNRGLGSISVKARAVDDVVRELKLKKVDWIKVDVEGAESDVLNDARQTMTRYGPRMIVEIHSEENARTILQILEDCEYSHLEIESPDDIHFYCKPIQSPNISEG